MVTTFTQEGVCAVLHSKDNEERYLTLDDDEREEQMLQSKILQESAQACLFERLRDKHVRMVHRLGSVKQMLDFLDQWFRCTSTIGLAEICDDYQSLRYKDRDDMEKFIDLFELKADIYEEAEGTLSEEDKVLQLSIAIPETYDSVTDWYNNQDEDEQTYDEFTKKVIEKISKDTSSGSTESYSHSRK